MKPVGTPTPLVAYCKTCGYDLRASGEAQHCPKCGRTFDPADPKTYARRPPRRWGEWLRRWTKRVAALLLVLAVLLGSTWGWLYWGWKSEQDVVAQLEARVDSVKPLGGWKLRRTLGPAGWVLERASWVSLPNLIIDADLVHLQALKGLRGLNLDDTPVSDAGLVYLQELKGLDHLYLFSTPITDAGLVHLKELQGLQRLVLSFTKVTDGGLVHLKELQGLKMLDLSGTWVTDAGLVHLKELRGLRELRLFRTKVSKAGVKELQAALPECKIYGP